VEGFEDEDMELQAALQASITGVDVSPTRYASRGGFLAGPSVRPPAREPDYYAAQAAQTVDEEPNADDDPVASSLARSKAIMERMLREQEAAFRVNYDDEIQGFGAANRWAAFGEGPIGGGPQQVQRPESTRKRTRGEDEEDEELRKALEASKAGLSPQDVVSDDSDREEMEERERLRALAQAEEDPATPRQRFADHTGVYDDDDEALQAALRASLVDAPDEAMTPQAEELSIPTRSRTMEQAQAQTRQSAEGREEPVVSRTMEKARVLDEEDEDEDMEEGENGKGKVDKGKGKEVEEAAEPVDVDEMRRRRLARFGVGG